MNMNDLINTFCGNELTIIVNNEKEYVLTQSNKEKLAWHFEGMIVNRWELKNNTLRITF